MFAGVYFALITTYGYVVLSKTDYLPPCLGGASTNTLHNVWKNYPIIDDPKYEWHMKTYFLVTFGYHIESVYVLYVTHTKNGRPDFMEMILHHCCTLVLYFTGYTTNWSKFGSLIMFLHDWADISTAFIKCTIEIKYKELVWLSSIINVFVWGYSRLYVFPWVLYSGMYIYPEQDVYPNQYVEGHVDQARSHFKI
jgi:hypothetical protein